MGESGRLRPDGKKRPALRFELVRTAEHCMLVVTEGVRSLKETRYHLEARPSDFGRAFHLRKYEADRGDAEMDGGDGYDVCIESNSAECSCIGNALGRRWCRHIRACRELIERGEL